MRRYVRQLGVALFATVSATAGSAHADRLDIMVQFLRLDGAPLVGQSVRLVAGNEANARSPQAGKWLVTDADGKIRRIVDAPVRNRRITLDNLFVWHKVREAAVGVELDILGRPALYWTELGHHRQGTVGQMIPYLAGRKGTFDQVLKFGSHDWSVPAAPDGARLTGIGAVLRFHEMEGGEGAWKINLVIQQHPLQLR